LDNLLACYTVKLPNLETHQNSTLGPKVLFLLQDTPVDLRIL